MNFRRLDIPINPVTLLIMLVVLSACTSVKSNQADVIQPGTLTDTTDQFATLTETYTPEASSTSLPPYNNSDGYSGNQTDSDPFCGNR